MRTLVLPLLLIAAGCALEPRYHVYGADLETRERARAFLWPADAEGRAFRYVVEAETGETSAVHTLQRNAAEPATPTLALDLAGATVVMPADASAALRRAGNDLLAELAGRHPALSTHLVQSEVAWEDVTTPGELVERARQARDRVAPEPTWGTLFGDLLLAAMPDVVVAPQHDRDAFLIGTRAAEIALRIGDPGPLALSTATAAELVARTATPAEHRDRPYRWLVLLIPRDAGADAVARCRSLAAELLARAAPDWAVVCRSTKAARAAQLVDLETFRALLPAIAEEAYQTPGP